MSKSDVREFMTEWFDSPRGFMQTWSQRKKQGLRGTARGRRNVPGFRPFDMLTEPQQFLLLFENSDQRIGVESVVGAQIEFTRHIDYQTLYFQFAGDTRIETEFGILDMKPGDLALIPEGIAIRSTGTADSLRMTMYLREPVHEMYDETRETSLAEYKVVRHGGPAWTIPADRREAPKGQVVERMVQWRDPSPDYHTLVDRDYEFLVDVSSTQRDTRANGIRKVRAFDCFDEITGRRGPGPKLVLSKNFVVEVYNTFGEQFAFHRALHSEEFGLQFAGRAINMSEFCAELEMLPGVCALVPLGIAHSVICDPGFLRIVPYSRIPWEVRVDPTKHAYDSRFETITSIVKPHAWHVQAANEAATGVVQDKPHHAPAAR